jgi:hypothetical protein
LDSEEQLIHARIEGESGDKGGFDAGIGDRVTDTSREEEVKLPTAFAADEVNTPAHRGTDGTFERSKLKACAKAI